MQSWLKPYSGNEQNIAFSKITVPLSGKQFDAVSRPLIQGLFVWPGQDG